MTKDDADLCAALINWFESQNINLPKAGNACVNVTAVIIALACEGKGKETVLDGAELAGRQLRRLAVAAWESRQR